MDDRDQINILMQPLILLLFLAVSFEKQGLDLLLQEGLYLLILFQ